MPAIGKVQRLAGEEQFDELRLCVERSFNKLRGRMDAATAQGWIGNSPALDLVLEGLLSDTEIEVAEPGLSRVIGGFIERAEAPEKPIIYLCDLYVGEDIVLDPTDGSKTIARAKELFPLCIDPNFMSWNLDVPAQPTGPMKVRVCELIADDSTCNKVYGSLGHSYDRLCYTQHQIIDYCVKYRSKFCQDGYGTYFLFKRDDEFFVAYVGVYANNSLSARVYRLHDEGVLRHGKYCSRFVLPKLEALTTSAS